jgi:hypothetical protein
MRWASRIQKDEKHLQDILRPQIDKIKGECEGAEQHLRIANLYRSYAYHPVMAVRSVVTIALQIPFLIAAYYMLSELPVIKGRPFLIISDLSQPDGLLFGLNLLPILMTGINLISACTTPSFGKREKVHAGVIALLFLILLYYAPSALLIFWTCNNLWVLLGNLCPESVKKRFAIKNSFGIKWIFRIFKELLFNPYLCIILALLAPFVFVVSMNFFIYTLKQILFSFAVLPVLILISCLSAWILCKIVAPLKWRYLNIAAIFLGTALVWLVIGILNPFFAPVYALLFNILTNYAVVDKADVASKILRVITYMLLLYATIKLSIKKEILRLANIFLSCFILLSIAIASLSSISKSINADYSNVITYISRKNKSRVSFKHTPNIYLFRMESMQSLEQMNKIYGVDISKLSNCLTKNGFYTQDSFYCNYVPSKVSDLSLVTQSHHFCAVSRGNEDMSDGASSLLNSRSNYLYSTLINNGYKLYQVKHANNRWLASDVFDKIFEPEGVYTEKIFTFMPLDDAFGILSRLSKVGLVDAVNSNHNVGYVNEVLSEICGNKSQRQNYYIRIDYDILHTQFFAGKDPYEAYRLSRDAYSRLYHLLENELVKNIETVVSRDPRAIIIILGDHGPRLLNASRKQATIKHGFGRTFLVNDSYSTIFAIRWPLKDKLYYANDGMSHVNLFTYIFASLAEDPSLLQLAEHNRSYTRDLVGDNRLYIIQEDNVILDKWKETDVSNELKRNECYR